MCAPVNVTQQSPLALYCFCPPLTKGLWRCLISKGLESLYKLIVYGFNNNTKQVPSFFCLLYILHIFEPRAGLKHTEDIFTIWRNIQQKTFLCAKLFYLNNSWHFNGLQEGDRANFAKCHSALAPLWIAVKCCACNLHFLHFCIFADPQFRSIRSAHISVNVWIRP